MKKRSVLFRVLTASTLLAGGCMDPFSYGTRAGAGAAPGDVSYEGDVYPLLLSRCSACHEPAGTAATTSLVLSSDAAADYGMVTALVAPGDPGGSALLQKASGAASHDGGGIWPESSAEHKTLATWVEQGAERK
jgi:hypothetical protein